MKIPLIIILLIHGCIHLFGFIKAFGFSEVKQLTLSVSKPAGICWSLAFIFFTATALMPAFRINYWWYAGALAAIVSQVLIILYWHDAKAGTVLNVVILFACIYGNATWSFYSKYRNDVKAGLQQETYFGNSLLTEADMAALPEAVKKYIRYSGSVGKPKVNNFKIDFSGKIRKDEQSEWMPFTSEQYNMMDIPTRLFFMKAEMKHLPVAGFHRFENGSAYMDIRLLSLFKVLFQDGSEMNMAETVTFFNDMCCMAPATLIDKRISWQEAGENVVKATFTNNGITITALLYFNDAGELINFKSDDRYNADAGKKLPWATPLKNYREVNGYKLAGYAETIYTYPDRDLCYGIFKMRSVIYNCSDVE